jgi:hypothetical protein
MGTPTEENTKAWEGLVERKLNFSRSPMAQETDIADGLIKWDSSEEAKLYNHPGALA